MKRSTMTAKETAEYLGISIDTVYKLVREKKIPCFQIGRRKLFKREAIDNWIEEQIESSVIDEWE
ncbi:DNA-binding protein [Oceanobacillus chungangensis]|uniref:DNA-binding protein n=1 Tax=Oceanobacillus chungangensis TaxID=1229152 RepID=A0A3D8PKI6_9BACI|nr:DNA-binding protein [Oceanobacillus chungangensis]